MALFLGVDSGTQSTKVLLIDLHGNIVARGQAHYDLIGGLGVGHKEQHPQTWIDALHHACHDAINSGCIDAKEIVAIGVSGQQHGFVPLDAKGAVIRPAKLWCDTATAPEADEIIARSGGLSALLELTGNGLPAGFTASKILWLRKHEPENYKRLATVLLPHDYINFHLTDRRRMEYGDASGTGLLDVRTRRWSEPVINAIDPALAGKLPPLRHSAEPCGLLRGGLAVQLGMGDKVLVSAGGGDNMMGAIGTGNVQPGIVSLSLGTSGTVYAYSQSPIIDVGHGEIAAFCDSTGAWLPLLCTMNVTVATELVKKTWKLDNNQLAEAAASVPAGAGGLVLLPYFEGERTPNVPDGTGVWFGYRESTHSAGHFARAAMEGATLGLAYGFQRLVGLGIQPREIRLTGGGSKSPLWRQIAADVFGVPVVCTTEPEGAALGAALQARWAWERQTNPAADIAAACATAVRLDETTRCQPNPANRALYDQMLRLQIALKDGLAPAFALHRQLIG